MKKKILLLLMAISIVGLTIGGCGKKSEEGTSTEETSETKDYGSLDGTDTKAVASAYIGDVQYSMDGYSFLMNVAAKEDSADKGFVGQMYMTLDEDSKQYAELLKPGKVVSLVLIEGNISNIAEATDEEIKMLQTLRESISTYEDDIEYIKNIPAADIKDYANSVYPTWTDEQIGKYKEFLAEYLTDETKATEYNSSQTEDRVMTAAERAVDYEANPLAYELYSSEEAKEAVKEAETVEMPDEFDINVDYTDEQLEHLIKIGKLIKNEDGTLSYPDGTPVAYDSTAPLSEEEQKIMDEMIALGLDPNAEVEPEEGAEETPEE